MSPVSIEHVTVEHYPHSPDHIVLGVTHPEPRLSWRFIGSADDWTQSSYELSVQIDNGETSSYTVQSSQNVLVPWPASPLRPLQQAKVIVKVIGSDGNSISSEPTVVEAGLADAGSDWHAEVVSCPSSATAQGETKRPFQLRKRFTISTTSPSARLFVTAYGTYELEINGQRVGDHILAPGWQAYQHRLHYQTFDISKLLQQGENTITAWVAEGWWAGALGWKRHRVYGERIGLLAQVELDGKVVAKTGGDDDWEWRFGEIIQAEIYDGEKWDLAESDKHEWKSDVESLGKPTTHLVSPEAPPVRIVEEIRVKEVITTPSGKTILDFGQNLVGWLRIAQLPKGSSAITLSHAEVLENKELGIRPLRTAKAVDRINYDEGFAGKQWEPKFTFHGFRYAQVDGWQGFNSSHADLFTAIVFHSNMERTGDFECSHKLINQLHSNVVWGWKGNSISVPTDCPQRDERLGWTGDLQVFASTASFLYDTAGFLRNWLHDMSSEQLNDLNGDISCVVPDILARDMSVGFPALSQAVWGDIAVLLPRDLHEAFGDPANLADQWESITGWLVRGVKRADDGLWTSDGFQLGDWLDPSAPPDNPADAKTDAILVADAYLVYITGVAAQIGGIIGKTSEGEKHQQKYLDLKTRFNQRYITYDGRMTSDSQTAYALALKFHLFETPHQIKGAAERLKYLTSKNYFKVGTGFAGTPVILHALAENEQLNVAYRMLQEKKNPSWFYSVLLGATTVWERWDSMLPDGTINPGEMTSFNHYALGAVASFMHKYIGGLSPAEPGWKTVRIAPRPGGSVTWAKVWHVSPYGRIACEWEIKDGKELHVKVVVPPNTRAVVSLPASGSDEEKVEEIGSGEKEWTIKWTPDSNWPPKALKQFEIVPVDDTPA